MESSRKALPSGLIKSLLQGFVAAALLALAAFFFVVGSSVASAGQITTVVFHAYHVESGSHPLPYATIVVTNAQTGALISKKRADSHGNVTMYLPAGVKVRVVGNARLGGCPYSGLQIFYRHNTQAVVPTSSQPVRTPLLFRETLRQSCNTDVAIGVG